jgi:peptidoglycan/xylan/chitin deacetylase (PgdA/CDA1 family)
MKFIAWLPLTSAFLFLIVGKPGFGQEPVRSLIEIPDKLVVLTFDDSAKSHFSVVRPLLQQYGFNATFFITEGFDFPENKTDYMTWDEIAQLHHEGFEIGNHTRDHLSIDDKTVDRLDEQLAGIEQKCKDHGIPSPTTFAWPGNATSIKAFEILSKHGIIFARRGGAPEYPYDRGRGFAYEPGSDHPWLLPSAGDARPNWRLDDFILAAQQARDGKVAILQFHGTPDTAHSWVNTPRANFEAFMKYLAINQYEVVALRDLSQYENTDSVPADPMQIIRQRKAKLAEHQDPATKSK